MRMIRLGAIILAGGWLALAACSSDKKKHGSDDDTGAASGGSGGSGTTGSGGTAGSSSESTGSGGSGGSSSGGDGGSTASGGSGNTTMGGQAGEGGDSGEPRPCTEVTDCRTGDVCDPDTALCVDPQCSEGAPNCGDNAVCVPQTSAEDPEGVCRPECTVFDDSTPCPEDQACFAVSFGADAGVGVCFREGTADLDEGCELTNISAGCVSGTLCAESELGNVCEQVCDPRADDPGCPDDRQCSWSLTCKDDGDEAAIGEACDAESEDATPCAGDGDVFEGVCLLDGSKRCFATCIDHDDCSADEQCLPTPAAGLGLCSACDAQTTAWDCATCQEASVEAGACCETEWAACSAANCIDYGDCVDACSDDAECLDTCEATYPDGAAALAPLVACVDMACTCP